MPAPLNTYTRLATFFSLAFLLGVPIITVAGTSSGWYSFRTELVGSATGCQGGLTQMDVALKELDSFSNINPAGIRIKLQVFNMENLVEPYFVRENQWAENTAISNSVCYDPQREGVRPIIEIPPSSQYQPHRQEMIVGAASSNVDRNNYLRGYVHLLPKSHSDDESVRAIEPREEIISQDPGYRVGVQALPNQYNTAPNMMMNGLATSLLYVWHHEDELWSRYQFSTPGSAYTSRVLPQRGLQLDGYYLWTVSHSLRSQVTVGGSGQGYWVHWVDSIYSGTTHPYTNFLLDRTPPSSNISLSPGEIVGGGAQRVSIINTIQDTLSGLAQTEIFIASPELGEVRVANESFSVGSGLTGGTKNTQEITVDVELPPGQTYEVFAITEDVAGNVTETNRLTHTVSEAPTAFPDLTISDQPSVLDFGNANLETGIYTSVDFSFPVENIGEEDVSEQESSVEWELSIQSTNGQDDLGGSGTVSALDAGASEDAVHTSTDVPFGRYEVFAEVDPGNKIDEERIDNNTVGPVELVVPPPDPELSIEFSLPVVRQGQSTTLYWTRQAAYPMDCALVGPGLLSDPNDPETTSSRITYDASTTSGVVVTSPRFNASQYTITCNATGSNLESEMTTFSQVANLEVIPAPFER